MRVIKRRRHQAGRLVAGKAEHDALVARAFVLVAAFVHALRDMGRLAVEIILERKTFPVKALLLIADALDGGAHRLFNLFQRARGPAGFVVVDRSEEHTSEIQSLMRNSYSVFRLKT